MRKPAATIFLLLISLCAFTQSKDDIQSYVDTIKSNAPYETKINAYYVLSEQLALRKADSAIIVCAEGISLASQHNDSINIAKLIQQKALALNIMGKRDSCAYFLYMAANIFSRKNDESSLAWVYNDIARLYRKTNDLDKSLDYYDKALEIFKTLDDKKGLGTIYNESGVVFEGKGDYDEAIRRYKTSLEIQQERNDSVGIGYAYDFLSGAYLQKKDIALAEEFALKSLNIRNRMKDSFAIAINYTNLGDIYVAAKNYAKAGVYYLESNRYAKKINFLDLILNNYKQLSELKKQQFQYEEAYNYLEQYNHLNDSLYQIQKAKQINEISVKYETAEKEKEIQQQQFEISKRNYFITAILILFVLSSLLVYSYFRRNQLKQQANLQKEIMQQQEMTSKAVIAAEEKERKRIAGDLHDGVGQMMSAARMNLSALSHSIGFSSDEQRKNYDRVVSLINDSCNEVRAVSHNMMPNALVKAGLVPAIREFIDRIDRNIIKINFYYEGFEEKTDSNTETVLYRVIQESVNNVLKHAKATILDISLIKDMSGLSVTIEDNGKGFNVNEKKNSGGLGLKNIQTRIEYLKGSIEWDSALEKGTLVAIYIPVD